ncbi:SapC family protein [Exilibacterium tricleocarpae]|uniref:SapC family protein n=1 Tax=Exilibacterium tricleocarpae TaxID=2591008 RepID=A0A545SY59_9GAMM|nr:SapC family protein [Exilibacterium tricleocarpae]TQV69904.1 SapC family protein [Exilibacterium tricleocarpae]
MAELVELTSGKHGKLKVVDNCAVAFAARQHVMNLRVAEIGKAVSSFPVFFTKNTRTGDWALSAVTSFEQGVNLFVENDKWTATYQPTGIQTYPLFLMRSPKDKNGYTVGIDATSQAFSEQQGEALFDDRGKASLYLSRVTVLLEADIKNDIQTYQFMQKLEELNLFKSIDIQVHYEDGSVQTLKGLHTLDEDKLQSLQNEQLSELNKTGYLIPMHAVLISIYQLNALIKKHNVVERFTKVKKIKLELTKDAATGA